MIFKTSIEQAHGRMGTFSPGFGVSVSDAVQASCSAFPFFDKKTVTTDKGDIIELIDGGYCANNPTLYAIADAIMGLKLPPENIRVVSVGVGGYGIGPFGASYLLIDLGAEIAPPDRWLVASVMLREIVDFWEAFLEQNFPKPNAPETPVADGE
jgi:hypothetical protein